MIIIVYSCSYTTRFSGNCEDEDELGISRITRTCLRFFVFQGDASTTLTAAQAKSHGSDLAVAAPQQGPWARSRMVSRLSMEGSNVAMVFRDED